MASVAIPLFKLRTVGDRSFSSVGPRLWNDLPLSLRVGSQISANADPGTTFSAPVCSYLKADDTQLYLSFDPSDAQYAMARLNSCIVDI